MSLHTSSCTLAEKCTPSALKLGPAAAQLNRLGNHVFGGLEERNAVFVEISLDVSRFAFLLTSTNDTLPRKSGCAYVFLSSVCPLLSGLLSDYVTGGRPYYLEDLTTYDFTQSDTVSLLVSCL